MGGDADIEEHSAVSCGLLSFGCASSTLIGIDGGGVIGGNGGDNSCN
jgi:hypothetical protein